MWSEETRKGIKFWIERLALKSVRELSFRGGSVSIPTLVLTFPKSLREQGDDHSGLLPAEMRHSPTLIGGMEMFYTKLEIFPSSRS